MILNHASSRATPRNLTPTLDEVEAETARTGRKLYEGAGITAADLSFENMYDGFTQSEIAVSGGPMPLGGNFTVWSATPD